MWRWFRRRFDVLDDASAFVDGELASDRRAGFEIALAASTDLQEQVDELRATKQLLASMAEVEVPRSFTISVAQAAADVPPAMRRREAMVQGPSGWFGGAALARNAAAFSVFASVALVAVVAIDVADDGGGASVPQFAAAAPQAQSLTDTAQAQSGTAALAEGSAEAADATTEQSFASEAPAADQAATEVVAAQAAVGALPSEQEDLRAGGEATLEVAAPTGDLAAADEGATKPPSAEAERDGSQEGAAAALVEEPGEEGGTSLTATAEAEAEANTAYETTEDDAVSEDPDVNAASDDSAISEPSPADAESEVVAEEAPIADAEMAELDASAEVADEAAESVGDSLTTEPLVDVVEEAERQGSENALTTDGAESTTSPAPATDEAALVVPEAEEAAVGPRTETDAQAPTRVPEAEREPESLQGEPSSGGGRETPAEADRAATTGVETEIAARPTSTREAEPTRPDAAPAPTLLPSGGSDDNTLVRVLEIVFGIAAGLSVVTLFFALRRRA